MATEWDEARHTLRASLGAMFDIWVAPVRLHGVDTTTSPSQVHLVAPNEVFRSWVETSYRSAIEAALRGVLGCNEVDVAFWVEGAALPAAGSPDTHSPAPQAPALGSAPQMDSRQSDARQSDARQGDARAEPPAAPPSLFPDLPPAVSALPPGTRPVAGERSVRTAARAMPRSAAVAMPQPRLFPDPTPVPEPAESCPAPGPSRSSEQLPPGKTFEHFVVGGCNQFAHAAARAVGSGL